MQRKWTMPMAVAVKVDLPLKINPWLGEALALREEGLGYQKIAETLGIGAGLVRRACLVHEKWTPRPLVEIPI